MFSHLPFILIHLQYIFGISPHILSYIFWFYNFCSFAKREEPSIKFSCRLDFCGDCKMAFVLRYHHNIFAELIYNCVYKSICEFYCYIARS